MQKIRDLILNSISDLNYVIPRKVNSHIERSFYLKYGEELYGNRVGTLELQGYNIHLISASNFHSIEEVNYFGDGFVMNYAFIIPEEYKTSADLKVLSDVYDLTKRICQIIFFPVKTINANNKYIMDTIKNIHKIICIEILTDAGFSSIGLSNFFIKDIGLTEKQWNDIMNRSETLDSIISHMGLSLIFK